MKVIESHISRLLLDIDCSIVVCKFWCHNFGVDDNGVPAFVCWQNGNVSFKKSLNRNQQPYQQLCQRISGDHSGH